MDIILEYTELFQDAKLVLFPLFCFTSKKEQNERGKHPVKLCQTTFSTTKKNTQKSEMSWERDMDFVDC